MSKQAELVWVCVGVSLKLNRLCFEMRSANEGRAGTRPSPVSRQGRAPQRRDLTEGAHRVVDVAGRAGPVHVDRPDNKLVLCLW